MLPASGLTGRGHLEQCVFGSCSAPLRGAGEIAPLWLSPHGALQSKMEVEKLERIL